MNVVKHSTSDQLSYRVMMGHASPDVHHVRPIGGSMLYIPVQGSLPSLNPRLHEGIYVEHTSGGVCKMLTNGEIVPTNCTRVFEHEFPDVSLIIPKSGSGQDDCTSSNGSGVPSSTDMSDAPAKSSGGSESN